MVCVSWRYFAADTSYFLVDYRRIRGGWVGASLSRLCKSTLICPISVLFMKNISYNISNLVVK